MNAPLASSTLRRGRLWTAFRADAAAHRTARAEQKRLRSELAAYDTPEAINDLLALVDGADRASSEIREILAHNLADYHRMHARQVA